MQDMVRVAPTHSKKRLATPQANKSSEPNPVFADPAFAMQKKRLDDEFEAGLPGGRTWLLIVEVRYDR